MIRWLGLFLLLAALYVVDFYGLGLNDVMLGAPWALLRMAAVNTAVLALLLSRLRGSSWGLTTAVFLLFFGVKMALVTVEAAYLPVVLPPQILPPLLVNGLVTAVVISGAVVWVNGRWLPIETRTQPGWRFYLFCWWRAVTPTIAGRPPRGGRLFPTGADDRRQRSSLARLCRRRTGRFDPGLSIGQRHDRPHARRGGLSA